MRSKAALVFLIIAILSFLRLSAFPLFDVDEGAFTEATREMFVTGDFINPTLNFEPRYDKPIFFYWLMAVGFKLFGENEFGARVSSAFFGFLLIIATYLFVKRIKGKDVAIKAILMLGTSIGYNLYTHAAITDMVLLFFISSSMYCLYLSMDDKRYIIPFYISMALAVLTKGLIGLMPVPIFIVYILLKRQWSLLRLILNPSGIVLFFIIALPWYMIEFIIHGKDFFDAFIIKHHFTRYIGVVSGHRGPLWYYIPVLALGFFPWSFFFPYCFLKGIKERKDVFFILWFSLVLIFFSLGGTKLPDYILPAFVPMAVITAAWMDELLKNKPWRIVTLMSIAIASVLAIAGLVVLKGRPIFPKEFMSVLMPMYIVFTLFALAAILMSVLRPKGISWLLIPSLAFILVIHLWITPAASDYLQSAIHSFSIYCREHMKRGDILSTYRINNPSIMFYSKSRILKLDAGQLKALDALKGRRIFLITKASLLNELPSSFHIIKKAERYALLESR